MRLKSDSLIKYFIGCWLFIVAVCASSQPLTVGVIGRASSDGSDITSYYEDVLRLALEKTRAAMVTLLSGSALLRRVLIA